MSRRKKDPLREITPEEHKALDQLSRSQTAPAVEVDTAPGSSWPSHAARITRRRPTPSAAAPAMPSLTSSHASTPRAQPR